MSEKVTYIWTIKDKNDRIDRVMTRASGVSRTQVQRWLKKGLIFCNQKAVPSKFHPKIGDVLEIKIPAVVPLNIEPRKKPLEILYEDSQILVLNKRPGEMVHPGAGVREDTLVSALLHHCKGSLSGIGGVERPGIVHRLDKDTSGVLVVAKTDLAHQHLAKQFAEHSVVKIYRAYVLGQLRWPSGSWTWNIGRHRIHRQKMAALKTGGKEALTDYKVIHAHPLASLLELRLHTGRTHQIRVHAAAAGHPVVGDTTYGRRAEKLKDANVKRQLLHAYQIAFIHPKKEKLMEFIAPLPKDFLTFEEFLKKSKT